MNAIVPGGGGDIGGACARLLASNGSNVLVVDADLARAVASGPIDGVVHAAGIPDPAAPLPEFDETEFDRVMGVNARGTFLGIKYALPHVRDGGAIVNVASVSGIAGYPMVAAYVASKHAVIGLTRTAALKDAPRGIRVTAVCPRPIQGRLMSAAGGDASLHPGEDPFVRGVPLSRYGRGVVTEGASRSRTAMAVIA